MVKNKHNQMVVPTTLTSTTFWLYQRCRKMLSLRYFTLILYTSNRKQQINAFITWRKFSTKVFFLWPQGSNLNRFFILSYFFTHFRLLVQHGKLFFSTRWEDIYVVGNLLNVASRIRKKTFRNLICMPSMLCYKL